MNLLFRLFGHPDLWLDISFYKAQDVMMDCYHVLDLKLGTAGDGGDIAQTQP